MRERSNVPWANLIVKFGSVLFSLLLFWIILGIKVPAAFSKYFHTYSAGLFLIVFILYFKSFQLPKRSETVVCLGLTMVLISLSLSYMWRSGFSDNFIIGGLLPYKDGMNYYIGANMILNGIPPINAGQSTERPLFPSFLAFMLLMTGQNLKIAIAIIVQLAGVGLYVSARQIRNSFGVLAASSYATFLYFYVQPGIGYTMSETLGVIVGCFGFVTIWLASRTMKWPDLLLGLVALMVAISARAGAFFIFPMLAIWVGWVFRGEKIFSLKMFAYTLVVTLIGYFLVNSIFSRLLGIPSGYSFGNFSYAIYGQVRGGTGWYSAIRELGTRNPVIVYRAAWEFFLDHPISLFIGFAKSYRDFFIFGDGSIFPFSGQGWQYWVNFVLWLGTLTLLVRGFAWLLKGFRSNLSSFLIAGFTGIFLSIPFLPPIDGGARFYAASMPFFFVLPAVGISLFSKDARPIMVTDNDWQSELVFARYFSIILITLMLIAPPAIFSLSQQPVYSRPVCPRQQEPFVIEYRPGSYIDLIKDGTDECGVVPDVCLNDFEGNNIEKSVDDFYQMILSLTENEDAEVRIISAINWTNNRSHYFYISRDKMPDDSSSGFISGCAVEIVTQYQSIYQVKSIKSGAK